MVCFTLKILMLRNDLQRFKLTIAKKTYSFDCIKVQFLALIVFYFLSTQFGKHLLLIPNRGHRVPLVNVNKTQIKVSKLANELPRFSLTLTNLERMASPILFCTV